MEQIISGADAALDAIGLSGVSEFAEASALEPRGRRPAALREAASAFRERFAAPANHVRAVRSVDLGASAYPVRLAFGGAVRWPAPLLSVVHRLFVVQFEAFDGTPRTLAWQPTVVDGAGFPATRDAGTPLGQVIASRIRRRPWRDARDALRTLGLSPEDVDLIGFDHLHGQDLRLVVGTTSPLDGETIPRAPLFPRAIALLQRREVEGLAAVHPVQRPWYAEDTLEDLDWGRIGLLEGDVELGRGIALVTTPGHTEGHQSLLLATRDGVVVVSANGVAADSWHPHLSKIPGLRRWADASGREVVPAASLLGDSVDQHNSMVKEKALADASRHDPRFLNTIPSAEIPRWRRQWPVLPTSHYGGIHLSALERPAGRRHETDVSPPVGG